MASSCVESISSQVCHSVRVILCLYAITCIPGDVYFILYFYRNKQKTNMDAYVEKNHDKDNDRDNNKNQIFVI